MKPVFLTLEEVLDIHNEMLADYGGAPGVRDQRLLESALAMPSSTFSNQYLHASLYDMAAAYLFHIVQNHPLVDGNKRTGAASALVFLTTNGLKPTATEEEFYDLVISVAEGKSDKPHIAEFFRTHTEEI